MITYVRHRYVHVHNILVLSYIIAYITARHLTILSCFVPLTALRKRSDLRLLQWHTTTDMYSSPTLILHRKHYMHAYFMAILITLRQRSDTGCNKNDMAIPPFDSNCQSSCKAAIFSVNSIQLTVFVAVKLGIWIAVLSSIECCTE